MNQQVRKIIRNINAVRHRNLKRLQISANQRSPNQRSPVDTVLFFLYLLSDPNELANMA